SRWEKIAPFEKPVANTRFGSTQSSVDAASIIAATNATSSTSCALAYPQQFPPFQVKAFGVLPVPSGSIRRKPTSSDLDFMWERCSGTVPLIVPPWNRKTSGAAAEGT